MEFIKPIIGSFAGIIGNQFLEPIKRHIGYLVYYNRNIMKLKDETENLDDKRDEVDRFLHDAENKFKDPISGVHRWKKGADKLNQKVYEFLEKDTIPGASNQCLNGHFQCPWSRYSSSRKASKMTKDVKKKIRDSPAFSNVAYDAPPPNLGPKFRLEGVKDFESRLSVINDVWEALKNNEQRMIGICGMGGVGKTTLVKELVKRVEAKKLFGVVALIEVSRKPNLTIQYQIVERLGLEIKETTLDARAGRLHEWIMKCEKSILLILDDVWEEVDFEAIGLPLKCNTRYKIVLTSRNGYLCSKIGSEKNFPIDILKEEEARELFKETAGNSFDGIHLATEIADECGGLPIAIVTIAKALKNKPKDIWDNALLQLKKSNMKGIPGMQKVHAKLQLSFDLLESEEAKSCFLLCCLFPEDYNVPIEDLVSYGMGLRLFGDVKNVHEVRIRVRSLIYELKESFLLLEGDSGAYYESVKMHDMLHDVAISIASTDKYAYLVNFEMKSWPANTERYKNCTAISLDPIIFVEHPVVLECPNLQLLRLTTDGLASGPYLPINFFDGMKELKVLSLAMYVDVQQLDALKYLRSLDLYNLTSGEIFLTGALINLEILRIGEGRSFEELPLEIGLLRNLRVLNIMEMEFSFIPSGVLSGLSKLEELYLPISRVHWGDETIASINELKSHPLTALQISVRNPLLLPDISNLRKFKICIGTYFKGAFKSNDQMNELVMRGSEKDVLPSGISTLLRNTEGLHLTEFEDEGFLVDIPSSQEMSQLRNMDAVQLPYFHNLKYMKISKCPNMKYFCPLSITKGLKQLQSIKISACREIEGVFYREDNEKITSKDDDIVEFPKLTNLILYYLPNLIGLCVDMNNAVVGLLSDQPRDDAAIDPSLSCKVSSDTEVVTKQLSTSHMNERRRIRQARLQHCSSHCIIRPTIFLSHYKQLPNLQKLKLKKCHMLEVLLSTSVAGQLVRLKKLLLCDCEKIKYVVGGRQEKGRAGTTKIVFPMLISLILKGLPQLEAFYPDGHTSFEFPSLQKLLVDDCPRIKTFCPTFPSPLLTWKKRVHSSLPGEKLTSRSIISRMTRRGRDQRSHDTIVQRRLVSSGLLKEDEFGHIHDHAEACSPFSIISLDGIRNLKILDVNSCNSFQVLFSIEESHADGVLNNLEQLELTSLENLEHVWLKIPPEIKAFQNLKQLSVVGCHRLKYLFSPQVAKLLVKLEDVSIYNCNTMEATMGAEEELEEEVNFVFPYLNSLTLTSLTKLRGFCIERYVTIEFPSLEHLELRKCNQMRIFSYGTVIATKLKEVKIDGRYYQLEKDLNATDLQEMVVADLTKYEPDDILSEDEVDVTAADIFFAKI